MPAKLEDYDVLYTIGSGSYGKCKKIKRKSDGKILVWKEMDYGTMTESEKQMLVSEVNLLRELKHKHIVRYYDRIIDRTNTTLYIVMEYCEGGDLASLISKCRKDGKYLDAEFVWRIFLQVAQAMQECHSRRREGHAVLHRDLKPANVFLDADKNVKLGDFGLARVLAHDTSFAKTFVGTPYYMSPEQMNYMSYNEKSDIWSLGCLIYELCSLNPPFTAANQKLLTVKIKEGKFRRLPSQFPDELNSIVSKMLRVNEYLRPSIDEILQTLQTNDRGQERGGATKDQQQKNKQTSNPAVSPLQQELLRKKEERLASWEKSLQERERVLNSQEKNLLLREQLADEKISRAESLVKQYHTLKTNNRVLELRSELEVPNEIHPSYMSKQGNERRVKFSILDKENNLHEGKAFELKERLHQAKLRGLHLRNVELASKYRSNQFLGYR